MDRSKFYRKISRKIQAKILVAPTWSPLQRDYGNGGLYAMSPAVIIVNSIKMISYFVPHFRFYRKRKAETFLTF